MGKMPATPLTFPLFTTSRQMSAPVVPLRRVTEALPGSLPWGACRRRPGLVAASDHRRAGFTASHAPHLGMAGSFSGAPLVVVADGPDPVHPDGGTKVKGGAIVQAD